MNTAFCYTYLINICEGCWDESFYCDPSRLRMFLGFFVTDDTLMCALVARETYNPN
jgi:hypothetical protein